MTMGASRPEVELPVKVLRDWMERNELAAASSVDGLA